MLGRLLATLFRTRGSAPAAPIRLNLGCGDRILPGYLNVDKFGAPDLQWDLEKFPWPWRDNAVERVAMSHVLEHLGAMPETFLGIMRELYRVCRDGAIVDITVPHPRHDHFIGDPTHVRPITPDMLALFSKRLNLEWRAKGLANTPLALQCGVDFEIERYNYVLEKDYALKWQENGGGHEEMERLVRNNINAASEINIQLRVVKNSQPA